MGEEKQNPPVDEESAALLKDLEEQDKTPAPKSEKKAAPKKKAAAKKPAPAPVVEKAKSAPATIAEKSDDNTVTNIGKNPRRIGGTVVAVGDPYTLTEQDLQNETLLLKIEHAIRLGVLSDGTDR